MFVGLKRVLKAELPAEAPIGVLFITSDTGEIFQGRGAGQALNKLEDTDSPLKGTHANLAEIQATPNPEVGDIRLATDAGTYYQYDGANWTALLDLLTETELTNGTKDANFNSITFNPTGSGLAATDVAAAIKELDSDKASKGVASATFNVVTNIQVDGNNNLQRKYVTLTITDGVITNVSAESDWEDVTSAIV